MGLHVPIPVSILPDLLSSLSHSVATTAVFQLPKPMSTPIDMDGIKRYIAILYRSPSSIALSICEGLKTFPSFPKYWKPYSLSNPGDCLAFSISSCVYIFLCRSGNLCLILL